MDIFIFNALHSVAGKFVFVDFFIVLWAEYVPYILIIGLAVFLHRIKGAKKQIYTFIFMALSVLMAKGFFVDFVRFLWNRPRPFLALDILPLLTNGSPAFPSGHASFFFVIAFSVLYFNRNWGYVFLVSAFFNSVARVSAGLHWPSDIIGGILVAGVSFGLTYLLLKRYSIK